MQIVKANHAQMGVLGAAVAVGVHLLGPILGVPSAEFLAQLLVATLAGSAICRLSQFDLRQSVELSVEISI